MTELAIVTTNHIQTVIDLVCNAVTSQHTARAYERALTDFMVWRQTTGQQGLSKATVQAHVAGLRAAPPGSRSKGKASNDATA